MNNLKETVVSAALCMLLALTVTSCDFMRKLAGRPTSEMIEAKKILIDRENRIRAQRADSLASVVSKAADNSAAMDTLVELCSVKPSDLFKTIDFSQVEGGYYVMLGSFGDVSNARRLAGKISDSGYEAVFFRNGSGVTSVGVGPYDEGRGILEGYRLLSIKEFFPKDAWIMNVCE